MSRDAGPTGTPPGKPDSSSKASLLAKALDRVAEESPPDPGLHDVAAWLRAEEKKLHGSTAMASDEAMQVRHPDATPKPEVDPL